MTIRNNTYNRIDKLKFYATRKLLLSKSEVVSYLKKKGFSKKQILDYENFNVYEDPKFRRF
ncbi:MAG: hypothetical protein AABY22_24360 [Nanoarchaeota archaeon]